jgi:hypothetical protein
MIFGGDEKINTPIGTPRRKASWVLLEAFQGSRQAD